jgi:hypothetical protein
VKMPGKVSVHGIKMSAVKRYPFAIARRARERKMEQQDSGDRIDHEHRRGISWNEGVDPRCLGGREWPLSDEKDDQQDQHDGKGKSSLRPAGRQAREDEMLFLRDNGGRVHHRSDSSQRLERAARRSYRFATLVTGCLSSPPFCPLGRLTTSKEASRPVKRLDWQGFPAAAPPIAIAASKGLPVFSTLGAHIKE